MVTGLTRASAFQLEDEERTATKRVDQLLVSQSPDPRRCSLFFLLSPPRLGVRTEGRSRTVSYSAHVNRYVICIGYWYPQGEGGTGQKQRAQGRGRRRGAGAGETRRAAWLGVSGTAAAERRSLRGTKVKMTIGLMMREMVQAAGCTGCRRCARCSERWLEDGLSVLW